jgi:hypothetical protein
MGLPKCPSRRATRPASERRPGAWFAQDSPLEQTGFEPLVPPSRTDGLSAALIPNPMAVAVLQFYRQGVGRKVEPRRQIVMGRRWGARD